MKNISIILIVLLVVFVGTWVALRFLTSGEEPVACTQEAKICADGSYVGRIGSNCEFAECPLDNNELAPNFGNDYIGEAIINYLLTQERFSWKTRDGSHNFCAIENLNQENELFPLYIWAYCAEYVIQDDELKTLSGSSGPVKINYPNEMSFYDLSHFSYEAPGDGSHYAEDIKKIFPEDVQQLIFDFDRKNIIRRIERFAFVNISSWESIKEAIASCKVESVWQTHDRRVGAKLKNGEELAAVEPKIDDIINIAEDFESKCGKILMGTE
jgi:hypothetical protein